jgi:hypothetical protein
MSNEMRSFEPTRGMGIKTAAPPQETLPAEEPPEPPEPEDPVDRVVVQSFPASDPPSWWAGAEPDVASSTLARTRPGQEGSCRQSSARPPG